MYDDGRRDKPRRAKVGRQMCAGRRKDKGYLARYLAVTSRHLEAWESVKCQGQGKFHLEVTSPPGNTSIK